jgi:photosystem II stability/assembly factor-like uncharacterized protein
MLMVDGANVGNRIVAVGDRGYVLFTEDRRRHLGSRAKTRPRRSSPAVHFIDAKNGWAVGPRAVIIATTDGGSTWTQQFNAAADQRPLLDVLFLDAKNGMAIGAYGAFYETADGAKSWNPRRSSRTTST